ncbi:anucleate primary sterigmata protein B [Grosmannia clavigera kw1407]|uniref:Anucleate primary sterigmata protein B n=1 Tax=Grosmannia clavigera (strain kw1407 / UAMH 11150) TaxID=655863 RepID=F0XIN7_GROCL|nr:anucleate primary sterigmata protein B [Grosmannia clavigera kw1407]EFX02492.1 anucleate primary sterigmata protein B [Grosmannia clavigera kw1407]
MPTIVKDGPDDTHFFNVPQKPTATKSEGTSENDILRHNTSPQQPAFSVPAPSQIPAVSSSDNNIERASENSSCAYEDRPKESSTSQQNPTSPSLHNASSVFPQHNSQNPDSERGISQDGTSSGLRFGKRPRFLKSRNASQRSSASSVTNPDSHDDVDSDVTIGLGTDYALQSGGAVSTLYTKHSASDALSRSASIMSVASTVDGFQNSADHLEALAGAGNQKVTTSGRGDEYMQTPKAKQPLAPPTDTVLARRVMDVQVPESLAREYKSKGGLTTPRKDFGVGGAQRPGRNMTLKEQSSTIERLSKENFDLKLKVMFLSDRLDKLSEDGIKEMIQENVEFRTNIAVMQRDNKALRRRVKELEKKIQDENDRPGTSRSATSSSGQADALDADLQDKEEEITYLRERVEEYTTVIERLRADLFSQETDKRRMADLVKSLQSIGEKNVGDSLGRQEEEDVWKDLLEQETGRREQADEENRKLRDDIFRLKQDFHIAGNNGSGNLHRSTSIYSMYKKPSNEPQAQFSSAHADTMGSTTSGADTLVEELRRESEQLRHENAELRKEVGAQTSMLTSRNKEKERLYLEIEDLKMAQRRGGGPAPSTVDSFLDRSASQIGARERSASRTSGDTRAETVVGDQEREDLENKNATLRDKINEVKLENQTLLQELDTVLQQKQETDDVALALQRDYENAMADLMAMQAERDELITELNDLEQKQNGLQGEFEDLRAEAQEAIDGYEDEADLRDAETQRLQAELTERTENFTALQEEMRKLSEALVGLEDETNDKVHRIQHLEQELGDANKELEELESKLLESNDKAPRLLVQQENSQGEIAFLREEQESDKITISRLEVNVTKAEELHRDEQERVKQLQAQIITEREQSESLATKDKKEMQHFVNELSREASNAKEEARKLRKSLTSREVEATEWKERLMELENNLREALGDLSGTRSSLLKSIAKLQRELENTVRELDATKASAMEKDRLIKQRDALLESHGLEARKVAEALDKERAVHRNTKHQFETFQKTHQHVSRTVSSQDARIVELETTKSQDKRRISQLEITFKEQLNERNNLLLVLWTRLSALCFSRNLVAAIKHIESIISGFKGRIKGVEKDLWREYHNLENSLEMRIKKLDRLEGIVRSGLASGTFSSTELQNRMMRKEDAYRQLKVENTTLRTANEVRVRAAYSSADGGLDNDPGLTGSPSPSIPTGPRERTKAGGSLRPKTGSRSGVPRPTTSSRPMTAGELALHDAAGDAGSGSDGYGADPRGILRFTGILENKLKLEREGRTMDRNEAVRRLREQEAEINRRNERDRRSGRDDTSG